MLDSREEFLPMACRKWPPSSVPWLIGSLRTQLGAEHLGESVLPFAAQWHLNLRWQLSGQRCICLPRGASPGLPGSGAHALCSGIGMHFPVKPSSPCYKFREKPSDPFVIILSHVVLTMTSSPATH